MVRHTKCTLTRIHYDTCRNMHAWSVIVLLLTAKCVLSPVRLTTWWQLQGGWQLSGKHGSLSLNQHKFCDTLCSTFLCRVAKILLCLSMHCSGLPEWVKVNKSSQPFINKRTKSESKIGSDLSNPISQKNNTKLSAQNVQNYRLLTKLRSKSFEICQIVLHGVRQIHQQVQVNGVVIGGKDFQVELQWLICWKVNSTCSSIKRTVCM